MFAGTSTVLPAESVNEIVPLAAAEALDALADAAALLAEALADAADAEALPDALAADEELCEVHPARANTPTTSTIAHAETSRDLKLLNITPSFHVVYGCAVILSRI